MHTRMLATDVTVLREVISVVFCLVVWNLKKKFVCLPPQRSDRARSFVCIVNDVDTTTIRSEGLGEWYHQQHEQSCSVSQGTGTSRILQTASIGFSLGLPSVVEVD